MANVLKGIARLRVPAGKAKPSPAIGQALGPLGVNMMEFCKQFNARSEKFVDDVPMRVRLNAYEDRSFSFDIAAPTSTWFIMRAAGIEKGSANPGIDIVGKVSIRSLYEIALIKNQYDAMLDVIPVESLVRSLMGSAKSMGLEVTR